MNNTRLTYSVFVSHLRLFTTFSTAVPRENKIIGTTASTIWTNHTRINGMTLNRIKTFISWLHNYTKIMSLQFRFFQLFNQLGKHEPVTEENVVDCGQFWVHVPSAGTGKFAGQMQRSSEHWEPLTTFSHWAE